MKDYNALAKSILENVGGKKNITNAMHCYTRLRLNFKDTGLVNLDAIKELDVIGAQFTGEQLQIIIGNEINEVYDAFIKLTGLNKSEIIEENLDKKNDEVKKKRKTIKGIFSAIVDGIVGCMVPILPMLIASGLLKAIVLVIQQFEWLDVNSPTLITLSFVADSAFYFMPVIIGGFAAKKFGANIALGGMIGAALIHPSFISAVNEGTSLSVFGLPIYPASYSSTVVPVILSVWVMSYVEKVISKYSPKSIRAVLEPVLTLLIMTPLTFCLLAPIGTMLSSGFASLVTTFYNTFGFIAVALLSAFIPWVVMVGMHVGTVPIAISQIAETGIDPIMMPSFFIANFGQGGACLAVGVKTKDSKLKSFAFSSAFSDIVPGISEPGMYGITLRYKTPMIGAMIGSGFGGLYYGLMHVGTLAFLPPNLFQLTAYVGEGALANNLIHACIGVVITLIVSFIATFILYKPEKVK